MHGELELDSADGVGVGSVYCAAGPGACSAWMFGGTVRGLKDSGRLSRTWLN